MRIFGTLFLLVCSNTFMNLAWYSHLKKPGWAIGWAVLISWLIALPEYALAVPANRIGSAAFGGPFTTPQLKIIQEAITLIVFTVITIVVLKERVRVTDLVAFALVLAGVAVSMLGRGAGAPAGG